MKKVILLLVCVVMFTVVSAEVLAAANEELLLYHWWTAGGEKEAIDEVLTMFKKAYPTIEVVENPVSGGGGGVMRGQIKTMVMAGQSPDTFQLTYGTGMLGSFAEILEPVDALFEDFPVPDVIKDMGTVNGHQLAIPLNIMRVNCLWYNKKLVEELGITPEFASLDDLYTVSEQIKAAGYIPYAVGAGAGQQFWWAHIAEQILVGSPHGGAEYLQKLYAGQADPANDPAIRELLEALKLMLDRGYINTDYSALTWDQAADLLMTDKAVFYQMGDWAKGHFTSAGWKPNVDFGYVPSPGTNDVFVTHLDAFGLVKGAPHPEAVIKWLQLLTSVEAENAFCPIKGATPPRLDAPIDQYDDISKDILKAFRNPDITILPDAWAQPPESWLGIYGNMFSSFVEHRDVDSGVTEFAQAYNQVFHQ